MQCYLYTLWDTCCHSINDNCFCSLKEDEIMWIIEPIWDYPSLISLWALLMYILIWL